MSEERGTVHELEELLAGHRFDQALALLAAAERRRPLTPRELVARSRCIQLASGEGTPPLEAAEEALKEALAEDDQYVPAILDLGWYYHAVQNDAAKARPFFERAYELSRQSLKEAISGRAGALEELESAGAATAFLRQAIGGVIRAEDLDEEMQEWLRSSPAPSD